MFLRYGKSTVELPLSSFSLKVPEKPAHPKKILSLEEMAESMDHPVFSHPVSHGICSGNSVLIVVSDATRATGVSIYLPVLIDRLLGAGVKEEDVSFIFATGVHRSVTAEEKKSILGNKIFSMFRTMDHHPSQDSDLKWLGKTTRGTDVKVNAGLFMFSKLILTGAVQFHYHAGFTGGRKSLIPGLASYQTATHNHLLSIDEKGVRDSRSVAGRLNGNPVHEDILEGALLLPEPFIINTVLDEQGKMEAIFSGDMIKAHEKAVQYVSETRTIPVKGQTKVVVAGCGGTPEDMNFIQAHKCIENCSHLVSGGGVLIVVAECADGFGNDDFLRWFAMGKKAMLARIRTGSMAYGQTALNLLNTLQRIHIIMVSRLDPEETAKMGVMPADSLEEAFQKAETMIGSEAEGYFIKDGTKYLFRIA